MQKGQLVGREQRKAVSREESRSLYAEEGEEEWTSSPTHGAPDPSATGLGSNHGVTRPYARD